MGNKMNIEIYKTSVETRDQATYLLRLLQQHISDCVMNFDLEDCDRILRIESNRDISEIVSGMFVKHGFQCQKL